MYEKIKKKQENEKDKNKKETENTKKVDGLTRQVG